MMPIPDASLIYSFISPSFSQSLASTQSTIFVLKINWITALKNKHKNCIYTTVAFTVRGRSTVVIINTVLLRYQVHNYRNLYCDSSMDSNTIQSACGSCSSIGALQDFLFHLKQQQQQKEILNLVVGTTMTTTTNQQQKKKMVNQAGRRNNTDATGMNVNAATASNGNAKVNAYDQISNNNGHTQLPVRRRKVAVIGGGVSGLSAAWHLSQQAAATMEVTVFEAADRLGGHAYTVPVPLPNGTTVEVDMGFMVYNETNYPNMVKWFEALNNNNEEVIDAADDVLSENTDMSLSVSLDDGKTLEWNSMGGLRSIHNKHIDDVV